MEAGWQKRGTQPLEPTSWKTMFFKLQTKATRPLPTPCNILPTTSVLHLVTMVMGVLLGWTLC